MPTDYVTGGLIYLGGVTFNNGGFGEAGTTLSWTSIPTERDWTWTLSDTNDNGSIEVPNTWSPGYYQSPETGDTFGGGLYFTGYTILSGGTQYPIFVGINSYSPSGGPFGSYYVPLSTPGVNQTLISSSGTSQVYTASASGNVYLCFGAGTKIATAQGNRAVETLNIGDIIQNATGEDVPVKWVGRQTIVKTFAKERASLVRISKGTLGAESDLYVTADHGIAVDGLMINASALVNGTTIDFVPLSETPEVQTVYHIETEEHDTILANGVEAETLIDYSGRMSFDNFAEYEALYGSEVVITECPMPRVSAARLVPPHLKSRLVA